MNNVPVDQTNVNPQPASSTCQNCGKLLNEQTTRRVGAAIYCEPCLVEKLGSAMPPPSSTAGSTAGGYRSYAGGTVTGIPVPSGEPNPGLAALLGLIPGVGAMYNEQYAKGVVHLLIFAVLVLLSHASGIFVLFVLGWVCYMAIEAHHTAKARRDGTPLPNPFGFNDIGERMGLGPQWVNGPAVVAAAREATDAAAATINAAAQNFQRQQQPYVTPPPVGSVPGYTPPGYPAPGYPGPAAAPAWGAPVNVYGSASTPPSGQAAYQNPYAQPVPPHTPPFTPPYVPPYTAPPYAAPTFNPVAGVAPGAVPTMLPRNRFPAGAVWLIGLGLFFLLSTLGIFNAVPGSALVGVVLIITGVWNFLNRMLSTGFQLAPDGTPEYSMRVLRALRSGVGLVAAGVLFLLDSFHIASWSVTWPSIIIVVGLMMLANRALTNSAAAGYANTGYGAAAQPSTAASAAAEPAPRVIITPEPETEKHSDSAEGRL